jgi:hypothetical protein
MTDLQIIREAFFALAGSRNPSLTNGQQNKELARCYELLAERVYRPEPELVEIKDDWSCTSQGEGAK